MKAWTFMFLRNLLYSEKRRSWRQSQLDPEAALAPVAAGGFSYEEAAVICDCAAGKVNSRVSRARRARRSLVDSDVRDGALAAEVIGSIAAKVERLSYRG